MENALLVGLSRQIALGRQMDVAANNLANMNTPGFKAEALLFEEYVSKIDGEKLDNGRLSFVLDSGVSRDVTNGAISATNAPLDVAIVGDGFFVVGGADADRYTRNGHFGLDDLGRLVTRDGDPVLDQDGAEIILDLEGEEVSVSEDGVISTSIGEVARLGVVEFEKPEDMRKVGGTLYETEEDPIEVDAPRIEQGALEMSNVAPILEMTRMIEVSRSYQSAGKLIETAGDLTRKAIEKLGRQK
ncbi:MAG: flagellar basal-body rod protein FlgF [Pseudomonadota bacterium]